MICAGRSISRAPATIHGISHTLRSGYAVVSLANFPRPEPVYCRCLNKKGNEHKEELKETNAKGKTHDYLLRLVVGLFVPLPEALGRLPLPLPWEVVTAGVSLRWQ